MQIFDQYILRCKDPTSSCFGKVFVSSLLFHECFVRDSLAVSNLNALSTIVQHPTAKDAATPFEFVLNSMLELYICLLARRDRIEDLENHIRVLLNVVASTPRKAAGLASSLSMNMWTNLANQHKSASKTRNSSMLVAFYAALHSLEAQHLAKQVDSDANTTPFNVTWRVPFCLCGDPNIIAHSLTVLAKRRTQESRNTFDRVFDFIKTSLKSPGSTMAATFSELCSVLLNADVDALPKLPSCASDNITYNDMGLAYFELSLAQYHRP
eukprot:jgi/Hompol1/4807/HPOL_001278-RA